MNKKLMTRLGAIVGGITALAILMGSVTFAATRRQAAETPEMLRLEVTSAQRTAQRNLRQFCQQEDAQKALGMLNPCQSGAVSSAQYRNRSGGPGMVTRTGNVMVFACKIGQRPSGPT